MGCIGVYKGFYGGGGFIEFALRVLGFLKGSFKGWIL